MENNNVFIWFDFLTEHVTYLGLRYEWSIKLLLNVLKVEIFIRTMGIIIKKKAVKIKPQFLYYIDEDGNICEQIRIGYKTELKKGEPEKKILKLNLKIKKGYLYYIDKEGNVHEAKEASLSNNIIETKNDKEKPKFEDIKDQTLGQSYNSDIKRYFINNYLKSKFSIAKLFGEPKCLFCDNKIILDLHHTYTYKKSKDFNPYDKRAIQNEKNSYGLIEDKVSKVIFVCPNHHYVFHRLIDTQYAYESFFNKHREGILTNLDLVKKRIKMLEKQNVPFYQKAVIEKGRIGDIIMNDRILRRYGAKGAEKILNRKGEVARFSSVVFGRYSLYELKELFEEGYLEKDPKCVICGYKILIDLHHVNKDKKAYFFCPNHHYMIHRHLMDRDGSNLTLQEIKVGIKNIEKIKIPYFKEVNEDEYKSNKGYNIMKIKE